MTNAERDLKVRKVHASEREISKVRTEQWKKLPNLNLGSPHLQEHGMRFPLLVITSKAKKSLFLEILQSS